MAPCKQAAWLLVLALTCLLIPGECGQKTARRTARDVSVLASGGVGVGEQQGASHGGTGSGPTQTYQESDTTGDRNVDGHPSETQTVADAGADHQSSTDQDISAVVQEEIHKILAAGEIGPVILPINDTATKAHTAADLAGTEQSGGRNPPLSSPTETGTRAGRAAEVTGGVNKDNTPVAVSSSIHDGSPTHLPPDSALGSPDGSRLTREDEDGSVNATDCLTLDECEEEIIDEFIETWLTYEGIPGMVFLIGNSVSLVGLFATFLTFALFKQLRSTPRGTATMNFILALFCAKLAFQVNPHFAGYDVTCSALAMLQHYFCLAAFLWMNVVAYDVMMEAFDSRQAYSNGTIVTTSFSKNNYKRNLPCYAVFAWGIPVTVVVSCCLLELYLGGVFVYGNQEQCGVFGDEGLLYTLAFPLTIISILNMAFFVATVRWLPAPVVLCRRKSQTPPPGNMPEEKPASQTKEAEAMGQPAAVSTESATDPRGPNLAFTNKLAEVRADEIRVDLQVVEADKPPTQVPVEGPVIKSGKGEEVEVVGTGQHISHRHVWAYVRMSVALSISWLSGFLSVFTQTYWLWIMFVAVNSLQGVLVFVSLVLTPPVLSLYMERFRLLPSTVCRNSKQPAPKSNLNFGPYECNLPVVSDGYVLLEETADIVFIQ